MAQWTDNELAAAWLASYPELSRSRSRRLVSDWGGASELMAFARECDARRWQAATGLARWCAPDAEAQAEWLTRATAFGEQLLLPGDAHWPAGLNDLNDPPQLLFVAGDSSILNRFSLAIVGARDPSLYGLEQTRAFAGSLAAHGVVVVSGHARGIDLTAHVAAMDAGGVTVAWLGGSHGAIAESQSRLYHRIRERGVLLSEYPAGMPTQAWMFPARNRLVAAHAAGVLVTEAAAVSGTMITVKNALELGRDVFAVPGDLGRPQSAGPNQMIRDGACCATGIEDILAAFPGRLPALGTTADSGAEAPRPRRRTVALSAERVSAPIARPQLSDPGQATVLEALLGSSPLHADELSERLSLPMPDLMQVLLMLEVEGHVERLAGNVYSVSLPR